MKRISIKNISYELRNRLTIIIVITIFVISSILIIRLSKPAEKPIQELGTEEDEDFTENCISRERALKTINKSIGSFKVIDDYQLFNGIDNDIVKNTLAEEEGEMYFVWNIDGKVDEDILIGFLFDKDSKVVWSESNNRDFWNPKLPKIDLCYKDKTYHCEMNFNDGVFSYKKRNTAIAIVGPEQKEPLSSVWAYDTKQKTLSLIWYNTILMAKGEKY